MKVVLLLSFALVCSGFLTSSAEAGAPFKKVVSIVLENAKFENAVTQPFLSKLAKNGALLTNMHAELHPSQPNYIAMVGGSTFNIIHDFDVTIDAHHLGDLMEAKNHTWKAYAEGYPGNCFLGSTSGHYARKHVPFLSFKNIQQNAARCRDHVVNANSFGNDLRAGTLPDYSFYVPDMRNDGHETSVAFADRWLANTFGPLMGNPAITKDVLFIVTFDEDDGIVSENHIYTVLFGAGIAPGVRSNVFLSHYNLLRLVEVAFETGTLGRNDASAGPLGPIWK